MKPDLKPKKTGNPLTKLYRPVYGILFAGSGVYQLILLEGKGTPSINILAGWLILTGILMLLPGRLRAHLAPAFLYKSPSATLALWGALPFLSLGTLLLAQGGKPMLALTGIVAGVLLITVSLLLRGRAKPGSHR